MRTDLSEFTPTLIIVGITIIGTCCLTLSCLGITALAYRYTRKKEQATPQLLTHQSTPIPVHRGSISDMTLTMSQRSLKDLKLPADLDTSRQSTDSTRGPVFNSHENKGLPEMLNKDRFEKKYESEPNQLRGLSPIQEESLERSSSKNSNQELEDRLNPVRMHIASTQMTTIADPQPTLTPPPPPPTPPPLPQLSFFNTLPPTSRQGVPSTTTNTARTSVEPRRSSSPI